MNARTEWGEMGVVARHWLLHKWIDGYGMTLRLGVS